MKSQEFERVLYFKKDTIIGQDLIPQGSLFKYNDVILDLLIGKYTFPDGNISNELSITGKGLRKVKDNIMFLPEFTKYQPIGINSKYVFKEYGLDGASFNTTGDVTVVIPYHKLYYFLYSQCLQKI